MPWTKGTVPPRLRGKGIPQRFINIFIAAFDSVIKSGGDEGKAYRIGYSAMHKAMVKAGYHKDKKSGGWSTAGEEFIMDGEMILRDGIVEVLEEAAPDGGLRFKGIALIDEAVSINNRYYSKAFNDKCMAATNAWMAEGNVVTIFSRHGKAYGVQNEHPTALPVGNVTKPFWRDGRNIMYEGFIVPTSEGVDLAKLMRARTIKATSIRADPRDSRMRKLGDRIVEEMLDAVIVGVDTTTTELVGIKGAGVTEILEEAPTLLDVKEDKEMEWNEVTLEELKEKRLDLLEEHTATVTEALTVKVTDLEAKLAEAEAKVPAADASRQALEEKVVEQTAEIETLKLNIAIESAAQIGVGKVIAEELRSKVKTVEEISTMLPAARTRALASVLAGPKPSPSTSARGVVRTAEEAEDKKVLTEGEVDDAKLTDDERHIMHLAS